MVNTGTIRRTVLDNGLTLVTERIQTVRSASLGIWVRSGSRSEPIDKAGVTHFIEHMLFKGTQRRTAREIAIAMDAMGGHLDAFTSKEGACYYAKILDERLDGALELLSDIVLNPRFDAAEMERERRVILEEIAATEDDPEDFLHESFLGAFWKDHPLGRPILGNRDSVERLDEEDLRRHFRFAYDPANLVIAAAGNLEHEAVLDRVREEFDQLGPGSGPPESEPPRPHQHFHVLERTDLEQAHVCLGTTAPSRLDDQRYACFLLNTVLGGSVSSRLFQTIREEHGLAYSVYSHMSGYSDAGYLYLYAGTRPQAVPRLLELTIGELRELREVRVDDGELERAKRHLKGNLMLSLENTAARMTNLARQEIQSGERYRLDEIIERIDAVSSEDLQELARRLFDDEVLSVNLLVRRDLADGLRTELGDGIELPDGGVLRPTG